MVNRVSVIGTGYLGTAHAACLASLGFGVLGLDTDAARIAARAAGHLPFHEPGLLALLGAGVRSGRLRFTGMCTGPQRSHRACRSPARTAPNHRFGSAPVDVLALGAFLIRRPGRAA